VGDEAADQAKQEPTPAPRASDAELIAAYEGGLTAREIAAIYRVDRTVVARLLSASGAQRPIRRRWLRLVRDERREA
jgi:DNA-binding transcriptional regulator LsrR (DeoR family)